MKVIVCGAGQVGWQIARQLSGEKNDVTVENQEVRELFWLALSTRVLLPQMRDAGCAAPSQMLSVAGGPCPAPLGICLLLGSVVF